jgi:gp16 family phage-associated protein
MKPVNPITRLPYPQTVQTARTFILSRGLSISELARANGLPRMVVQDLLRPNGQLKGTRGQAHLAAVVLGLKPDPESKEAQDPKNLTSRINRAAGAVA